MAERPTRLLGEPSGLNPSHLFIDAKCKKFERLAQPDYLRRFADVTVRHMDRGITATDTHLVEHEHGFTVVALFGYHLTLSTRPKDKLLYLDVLSDRPFEENKVIDRLSRTFGLEQFIWRGQPQRRPAHEEIT